MLKFGSLFDGLGAGFQQQVDKMTNKLGSVFNDKVDASGLQAAAKAFKDLTLRAENSAKRIDLIKNALKGLDTNGLTLAQNEKERLRLEKLLNIEVVRGKKIEIDRIKVEKELAAQEEKIIGQLKRKNALTLTAADVTAHFESELNDLIDSLKNSGLSAEDMKKEMAGLKFKEAGMQLANIFSQGQEPMDALGASIDAAAGGVGHMVGALTGIPILGDLIEKAITKAFDQVVELNDALIKLQRATGGMAKAANLGFDAFGNATGGLSSLKTMAIEANVSVEQFSGAIQSLMSDGFGQTIGAANNLKNASKELQKFGIEAARLSKLYGADIGPAVRGLFQNYGVGIGEATDVMKEGADTARELGLSVSGFTSAFEDVVKLTGELYFNSTKQMQEMALIATQLGISVGAIAKGVVQMKGINDLFKEQQKTLALGMSNTANSLAQIYALRSQGKGAEAARLELASMAKDIQANGFTGEGGRVTQQGISTLQAQGASAEQIEGIQKLAMQAERTGIALEDLGKIEKLSAEQKRKLALDDMQNMTLSEKFNKSINSLWQAIIDPLSQTFGPIIGFVADAFGLLIDQIVLGVKYIALFTQPLRSFVGGVFKGLSNAFNSVRVKLTEFGEKFNKIVGKLQPVFDVISSAGEMLGDVLGFLITEPLSLLIDVFDLLADGVMWVVDLLKPLFEGLSSVSKWFSEMASEIGGLSGLSALKKILGIGDSDEQGTAALPKNWEEVLGAHNMSAEAPTTRAPIEYADAKRKEQAEMEQRQIDIFNNITQKGGSGASTNVTNVRVDGAFSSEQSIKAQLGKG